MRAAEALGRLGGTATRAELLTLTSRRALRTALANGDVHRHQRGTYALVPLAEERRRAAAVSAVLSGLSAAQHHGWKVKWPPAATWVTAPRGRKVRPGREGYVYSFADLGAGDVVDGVTSKLRTVVDCARRLPFDEALAVADSALRAEDVTRRELLAATASLKGTGAAQARLVALHADGRAANPFESVLRALVIECGLLDFVPQLLVVARGVDWHPDLVDEARRIIIEADSYGYHGDRIAHAKDCVRHTAFAVAGWRVLRFDWDQVMRSPSYVRAVLTDLHARLVAA